jgi:hypothetical protein
LVAASPLWVFRGPDLPPMNCQSGSWVHGAKKFGDVFVGSLSESFKCRRKTREKKARRARISKSISKPAARGKGEAAGQIGRARVGWVLRLWRAALRQNFRQVSDKDFPELFSRRAPMNRAASSPVLRTPSPPLGAEERDGERRFMGRSDERDARATSWRL